MRHPTRQIPLDWSDMPVMHWEDLPADVRADVREQLLRLLRHIAAHAVRTPEPRHEA